MKQEELKDYISLLLKDLSVDKKIFDEVQNIELLLSVYMTGLRKEDFPIDYLFKEFDLEEDIPAPLHTLVGQMAILKAKTNETPRVKEYLRQTVSELLKKYRNYFSTKP